MLLQRGPQGCFLLVANAVLEKLDLERFTEYTFLSRLHYSPDGAHACFVLHKADLEENKYASTLWLYAEEKNEVRQLTTLEAESDFVWLSDTHILFPSLRNSKDKKAVEEGEDLTVFYRINIHGGEAQEAFRLPFRVTKLTPLDHQTFLFSAIYNANRPPLYALSEEERKAEGEKRKEESAYHVVEEIPFWFNGQGFISKNRNRLYLYDQNANTYEPITDESTEVESFSLSPDKSKCVLVCNRYEGKRELYNDLYYVNLPDTTLIPLPSAIPMGHDSVHFVTEQDILCLASDKAQYGINENAQFYRISLPETKRELLTPDFDSSTWNSVNSDCRYGSSPSTAVYGNQLYFIITEGADSKLCSIDTTGEIKRVIDAEGSVDSFSVHSGKVLFVGMRDLKLQELYKLGSTESQITSFNQWVVDTYALSTPEHRSIEIRPGTHVDGWVLKPRDYDPKKKYPGILSIHGGPKTAFGTLFIHEMQYFASQGYFVFFCNPRGSDGKGNAFADIRGRYGSIDYEDIMGFTDEVLRTYPEIDDQRLAVTGGSYGGFMTNWIIGQTHRFQVAASQRSISNWVSMGYTSDIGYFFEEDQIGATPWQDIDRLWDQSPLKYADKVKTPTLFIHSHEDYRCWVPEALQMFTALRYHGVESRLCLFKGENHELSRSGKPKARIRRLREISQWFDTHIKTKKE